MTLMKLQLFFLSLFLSVYFLNIQGSKKHLPSNYLSDLTSHDDTIHSPFVNDEPRLDHYQAAVTNLHSTSRVAGKYLTNCRAQQ